MSFIQTLTLVKVDDKEVKPVTKYTLIEAEAPNVPDNTPETDSDSDTDFEYKQLNLKPIEKKRGRRPLTPEEKEISNILKKEYFKLYYKNNPEKYQYIKYDYNNSCIYKLTTPKSKLVYYGSTILPLPLRLKRHLSAMRNPKNSTYMQMAEISTKAEDWSIEPVIKIGLESK